MIDAVSEKEKEFYEQSYYDVRRSYYDIAIEGQPQKQCYYHRSLQDIFNLCFDTGFVIDGFYEECYFNKEIPDIIIVRAIKIER